MAMDMATMQRWQRAAQKAIAADLPHQLRQRGGSILVPSKTTSGRVYHVSLEGGLVGQCDCEAGLNGKPCAHRAAVVLRVWEKATGTKVVGIKPAAVAGFERYLRAA